MNGARRFWLGYSLILLTAIPAAVLAIRHFHAGWPGTAAVMLILGVGLPVVATRQAERHAADAGSLSPALRRYNRRMLGGTLAYVVALFTALVLYKELHPAGVWAWLTALLPAAGALAMILPMALLLREETDEYIRFKFVQQALSGTGFLLVVATLWGFFEQFELVPHVPAWAALPVFAIGLGVSVSIRRSDA